MFTGLKAALEGVSDLKMGAARGTAWPLSCCHVQRAIRSLPTVGLYPPSALPSLRSALRRGLQDQAFLLLAAVRLFGLCSVDLARKFARHQSLSQRACRPALSSGAARSGQAQHFGRCVGQPRLAHFRRGGAALDRPSAPTLRGPTLGSGFEANHLCAGRQHHRSVPVGLSLGALRRAPLGPQNPHPIGGALGFARANTGQSGQFPGRGLAGRTALRAGRLLSDGPGLCGLAPALRHRTGPRLVRRARQEIVALLAAAFPTDRSGERFAQRSNHQSAGFLCGQKISRQVAPGTLLRWATATGSGVLDQPFWFVGAERGATVPATLAGRTVLSLDQATSAHQELLWDQRHAVRTQLWVAVSVYALVAILKKRLGSDATLYEILQILSVSVFEKTPIEQLFQALRSQNESTHLPNQLSFWDL